MFILRPHVRHSLFPSIFCNGINDIKELEWFHFLATCHIICLSLARVSHYPLIVSFIIDLFSECLYVHIAYLLHINGIDVLVHSKPSLVSISNELNTKAATKREIKATNIFIQLDIELNCCHLSIHRVLMDYNINSIHSKSSALLQLLRNEFSQQFIHSWLQMLSVSILRVNK